MVSRGKRNTVWMFIMLVLLGFGGICFVGFWQTYDLKCFGYGGAKTWDWQKFPPQYVCSNF